MKKSMEELLYYAVQMRNNGNSYEKIRAWLTKVTTGDEERINAVMTKLANLEDAGKTGPEVAKERTSVPRLISGAIMVLCGIVMLVGFTGFYLIIPAVMILAGVLMVRESL